MDIVELGLRVDATGAIEQLGKFTSETDKAAAAAKRQDERLRQLVESNNGWSDSIRKSITVQLQREGLLKRFIQIEQQVRQEEQQAIVVETQLAEAQKRSALAQAEAAKAAENSTRAYTRMRSGVASLVSQVVGANPAIAQLTSTLGQFSIGSQFTVGVLAGVGAVGAIVMSITSQWRAATKASDDLVSSLAKQRRAFLDATVAGAQNAVTVARNNLANTSGSPGILGRLGTLAGTALGGIGLGATAGVGASAAAALRLQVAKDAAEQARITLQDAEDAERMARFDRAAATANLETETAEKQKEYAREAKTEDDRAIAALGKRIALASKLAQLSGLAQAQIASIGQNFPQIGLPGRSPTGVGLFGGVAVPVVGQNAPYQDPTAEGRARADFQKDLDRRDRIMDEQRAKDEKKFGSHIGKLADVALKAGQIISQAIEYGLVQKLGGGTAAGNIGASVAKTGAQELFGSFSAFGSKALGSAIFGPLAAGVGAAFGSAIDSVFDFSGKARAAAEALREMQLSANEAQASFIRQTQGYLSLEDKLADALKDFNVAAALIAEAYDGREEQSRINEIYESYLKRIDQIKATEEQSKLASRNDLEVRYLRTQGKDKEADRLALENRQRAELFEAERAGFDAAYIARLKEVQALERTTAELDKLATTALNVVNGYKLQATIFQNVTGRSAPALTSFVPPATSLPYNVPGRPSGPPAPAGDLTVNVVMDGKVVGQVVLKKFQQSSQRTNGDSTKWASIQSVS